MNTLRIGAGLIATTVAIAYCPPARAARVDLALRVQTAANEEVEPVAPGVWNVPLGYDFKVVLSGRVTDPNTATTAGRTYPLGLSFVGANLETSAAQVIDPAVEPNSTVDGISIWQSEDFTGWGFPWFNAIDRGGDGDLDPAAVGFNIIGPIGKQPSESNQQLKLAINEFADLIRGGYTASNVGTTRLDTVRQNDAQVFFYGTYDAGLPPRLLGQWTPTVDAGITINVVDTAEGWEGARNVSVPEPAALSAGAAAALLLTSRRRRPGSQSLLS